MTMLPNSVVNIVYKMSVICDFIHLMLLPYGWLLYNLPDFRQAL